ncbi:PH-domain-containing protein [Basidiobolus meristosporus CBS 931.73]|uniref:PH-domain-containing protein n=1 Tax=Basidiobolus meristosporus CBS 931.73 TaxID=1314790 RepID=A0A1Y1Z3H5_9FUNG|nr:PH-domain-containing protein [Basidiobolus meristosporus CBS 931.73]|eukprot:ORY04497.1 PH-domain-containing protein [Basidiobolus meristosporus CBS 931.73]
MTLSHSSSSKLVPLYSRDDTCISAGLPSLGKSEEHEEFASLFHNTRRGHVPPPLHVGLELELLRNSLGKLVSQRRNSKIHEANASPVSSNFEDDVENSRPLSPGVYSLLKDLENCLEKAHRSDEPVTPRDADFHGVSQVAIKSGRDSIPSIYSMSNSFKHEGFIDRSSSMIEYKHDSFVSSMISADKLSTHSSPNACITVNEAFISATLAGWLSKLYITNPSFLARKTWKRRLFILSSNILYRFKSLQANTTADEYLEINSSTIACVSDKFPGKKWVIEITNPGTSWFIQAEHLDELKTWLNALKSAIIKSKYSGRIVSPLNEPSEYISHESVSDHSWGSSLYPVVLEDQSDRTRVLPPQPPVPQGKPPQPPSQATLPSNHPTDLDTQSGHHPKESRASLDLSSFDWSNTSIDKFLVRVGSSGPGL